MELKESESETSSLKEEEFQHYSSLLIRNQSQIKAPTPVSSLHSQLKLSLIFNQIIYPQPRPPQNPGMFYFVFVIAAVVLFPVVLLYCALLPLTLLVTKATFWFENHRHHNSLPPGSFGWPLIGETIEFFFNHTGFYFTRRRKYQKHVFVSRFFDGFHLKNTACVFGVELLKQVDQLSTGEDPPLVKLGSRKPLYFEKKLGTMHLNLSGFEHTNRKKLILEALSSSNIAVWRENLKKVMDKVFGCWISESKTTGKPVSLGTKIPDLSCHIILMVFFGIVPQNALHYDEHEEYQENLFRTAVQGMFDGMINFKSRQETENAEFLLRFTERMYDYFIENPAQASSFPSVLQSLIKQNQLSKDMVINEMCCLIMGDAFIGLTHGMQASVYFLLQILSRSNANPYKSKLRVSLKNKDEAYLMGFSKEARRLLENPFKSLVASIPLLVSRPIQLSDSGGQTYTIPQGWRVMVGLQATNNDPQIWGVDSAEFVPERLDGVSEDFDFKWCPHSIGKRMSAESRRCAGEELMDQLLVEFLIQSDQLVTYEQVTNFEMRETGMEDISSIPFGSLNVQGLKFRRDREQLIRRCRLHCQ